MASTSYLVEKKDGGLVRNRAGNGHALLLPAGMTHTHTHSQKQRNKALPLAHAQTIHYTSN